MIPGEDRFFAEIAEANWVYLGNTAPEMEIFEFENEDIITTSVPEVEPQ